MQYRFCFLLCVLTLILAATQVSSVFAKAPSTAKIVFASTRDGNSEIYIMNPDGSKPVNLTRHPSRDLAPVWSPTGEHIAFNSNRDGTRDIYIMDADGKNVRKVFRRLAYREYPTWSPDGKKLAYTNASNWSIYVGTIEGGHEERITSTNFLGGWPAWSPDSSEIAFILTEGPWAYSLKVVNLETRQEKILMPKEEIGKFFDPDWSPDGTRIAFYWSKKGIYVMDRKGRGLKRLVSNASRPAWSPLGDELVYGKKQQLFKYNLGSRRSKQLTHGAINFGADWFNPQVLPVHPQSSLLTTKWATLKQR